MSVVLPPRKHGIKTPFPSYYRVLQTLGLTFENCSEFVDLIAWYGCWRFAIFGNNWFCNKYVSRSNDESLVTSSRGKSIFRVTWLKQLVQCISFSPSVLCLVLWTLLRPPVVVFSSLLSCWLTSSTTERTNTIFAINKCRNSLIQQKRMPPTHTIIDIQHFSH